MAGHDVVGDVHGHHERWLALMAQLGYRRVRGALRHPEGRVAVHVGDLVDRGPGQVALVADVRDMVEAGSAKMVLGNHEANALCFGLLDPRVPGSGKHIRRRRGNNVIHHQAYLDQVGGADSALHGEHLRFFASLPLWLDLGDLRVVHACWHRPSIDRLAAALGRAGVADGLEGWAALATDPDLFDAMEVVCKGIEAPLPPGVTFVDPQGSVRKRGRVCWWVEHPRGFADVVGEPALRDLVAGLDLPVPEGSLVPDDGGSPILFGHYWMAGEPRLVSPRRACLDWSVAKGGAMCAYRHDGERVLDPSKLAWV